MNLILHKTVAMNFLLFHKLFTAFHYASQPRRGAISVERLNFYLTPRRGKIVRVQFEELCSVS